MKVGQLLEKFEAANKRHKFQEIRAGDMVKLHYKIKEGGRERVQIFEGVIIAAKKMNSVQASVTVRKVSFGVGVERTFPLHSPWIAKIERIKSNKVRRAKLYYVRNYSTSPKKLRFKDRDTDHLAWQLVDQPDSSRIKNQDEPESADNADAIEAKAADTSIETEAVEAPVKVKAAKTSVDTDEADTSVKIEAADSKEK